MSIGRATAPGGHGCPCAPDPADLPVALLDVAVENQAIDPPFSSMSVGYERRVWRADALARHIVDWVLDFALRPGESGPLARGRAMDTMRRAVRATFGNGNDRGLPGEILLHAVCRQFYGSDTVINKVYFKTADNDTYKGFDAVHYVHTASGDLELWLGEAKFYKSVTKALDRVLTDLEDHFQNDYLRTEFAIIADKIDDSHPHADELRLLMHPNTSLDEVFDRIVVPVFVTYDSPAAGAHDRVCPEYRDALEAEARRAWLKFKQGLDSNLPVSVRLILLPMHNKEALLEALDRELAGWV